MIRADGGMGAPGEWVQVRTPQGCFVYWFGYFPDSQTLQQYYQAHQLEYRGSGCEPGKPANGVGEILVYWSGRLDMRMRGRVTNGVIDGSGDMAYTNDPYWSQDFVRGCPAPWIPEGGCIPFAGRAQGMDEGAPSGLGGAVATASPAASPGAAGGQAGGNVWGTCVSLEDPRPSGTQMIYAFRNRCTKTITVSFCMTATYEAAGDWNLCSQRSHKTYDIRAGERFEFPFTPVKVGSGMSDGRVVDRQEVGASGAACIGSSPSVHVEDGALVFEHC